MENISFSSLGLRTNTSTKTIKIGEAETEIEVKQYLPAEDKNSLLEITIQDADMGTVVNTFAIDCLFHLYLVLKYTNIQMEDDYDKFEVYDALESSGIINQVISAIPPAEYEELHSTLEDMLEKYAVYRNSFKGALEQLQMFVPQQAEEMKEQIEGMNISSISNITQLANALGFQFEENK